MDIFKDEVFDLLVQDQFCSIFTIVLELNISESTSKRCVNKLRTEGRIRRVGPDRGGHWEVIKK